MGLAGKASEEDLSPQVFEALVRILNNKLKDLLEHEDNGVVVALHTKKLSDEVHIEKVLPFKTLRRLPGCI